MNTEIEDMIIDKWAEDVISSDSERVIEYKNGNEGLLGYFVGMTMKKSRGQLDVSKLNKAIKEKLNKI
jgi:aspartyl-tRNA(Asn)/glutamyl-tRNA(Gln) amidotransferase subunit B